MVKTPRRNREPQPTPYRPLVIQCGETGLPTWKSRLKTWMVCWPDHCYPSWTIILWTIGSCVFFVADTASDMSVAVQYYDSQNYFWASLLVTFVCLPTVISIIYFIIYKKMLWYQAYPVGMIYWAWCTLDSYFNIPYPKKILSPLDAIKFMQALREFQNCNRQRGRVGDIDVYFGSLPQLILQSYIAATVAMNTGMNEITLASWLSLCLSSLNLLRYEPSSRESRTGIIVDLETVLEPAMYDYIAQNVFDLMSIVPRAVAVSCFLTAQPFLGASIFFPAHITVTFLWFWLSAPKRVPGFDSRERDFRGQRRDRDSYLNHLQAAVASLVFPPTHRVWPKDFQSFRERLSAVLTKQFVVVTGFQFLEVCSLMTFWMLWSQGGVRIVYTFVAVMTWTTLRVVLHVAYYVVVLFPFYTYEWEQCCRRRGLIAKAEILRMSETFGGFLCPQIRPQLEKILEISSQKFPEDKLVEMQTALEWLQANIHYEQDGVRSRTRTIKHRLMAMGELERSFLQNVRMHAVICLGYIRNREIPPENSLDKWKQLLTRCQELANFWEKVLLACLTHRLLPAEFREVERNVKYSEYPKMYDELVVRNNLIFKRAQGLPLFSVRLPAKPKRAANIPIENNPILRDLQEEESTPEPTKAFGERLNLEFVT